jgi:predicted RNase H-like nuclease
MMFNRINNPIIKKTKFCKHHINLCCRYDSKNCNFSHGIIDFNFKYGQRNIYDEIINLLILKNTLINDYFYICFHYNMHLIFSHNNNAIKNIEIQLYNIYIKIYHINTMLIC